MTETLHPENQYLLHDAVHGTIDLELLNSKDNKTLLSLINSLAVQRLRNIKQLGFAYFSFQSADHSRYSHAIGTMYLANKIYKKVFPKFESNDVFGEVKNIFNVKKEEVIKYILLTALLQDIGELPFNQATNKIIRPTKSLFDEIYHNKLNAIIGLTDKQIFTLSIIYKHTETNNLISEIIGKTNSSFEFLTFLLVGAYNENLQKKCIKSLALRQIVDGVVDADRLDYVYRDAHHTFGNSETPDLIISSLIGFDKDTPFFNDSGPISDFFLKRWHLWNNVYFAPENRFNSILLQTYLKGTNIFSISEIKDFRTLSLDDFLKLDDFLLWNDLKEIGKNSSKITVPRSKTSLENLLLHKKPYEWYWIEDNKEKIPTNIKLPEEIFYDTFSNYKEHKLYKPKSVRIESKQYNRLSQNIFLEDCSGTIGSLIKSGWETLAHKKCFLVFEPLTKNKVGIDWKNYFKAVKSKALYDIILCLEDGIPSPLPEDTWTIHDKSSHKLFISYSVEDNFAMEKIIRELYRLKIAYKVVKEKYNGAGKTKKSNCLSKMKNATQILVLGSISYLEKTKDNNTGVSIEFDNMKDNKANWSIKILGIENDHNLVKDRTWENIIEGYDVLSYDVNNLSSQELRTALQECLK